MNNGGRNGWGEATSIRKFREAKRSRRREREKKRIDGCITKRSMVIEGRDYEISKIRETRWNRWIRGSKGIYPPFGEEREREKENTKASGFESWSK